MEQQIRFCTTSDVVRQRLAGKGFACADQGEHALKGFDQPARLYEVKWRS